MKRGKLFSLLLAFFIPTLTLLFTGCSPMKIEDFSNTKPAFITQNYFNGKLTAYGIIKDRNGKIMRTFKAIFYGSWDENGVGTLDETFVYNDGETQERIWKFVPTSQNTFDATAHDIVGVSKMLQNGNTLRMDYVIEVPYKDTTLNISVRDWLHLQEDGIMMSHSKMKKFGFVVGELFTTVIKEKSKD